MLFRSSNPILVLFLLFTGPLLAGSAPPDLNTACKTSAEPVNAVPAFKRATAEKVFQDLKKAVGLAPADAPYFELVDALSGDFSSAMINYSEQKIYLEEAAYDICTKFFGADSLHALAVYLSHELAHFRSNHKVKSHYSVEFKDDIFDTNTTPAVRNLPEETKKQVILLMFYSLTASTEAEADLSGGFLAYLAGFKTIGLGEKLLQKTYEVFSIDPNPVNKNYPTLKERKAIVRETEKELANLIHLFELGNLLTAIGRYDEALNCHQQVLQKFQSREIYNNIGVLYTLAFLEKTEAGVVEFFFPVELDIESRMDATKGIESTDPTALLEGAIEHFQSAVNRDPDYAIGYLNLANAHGLKAIISKQALVQEQQLALAEAFALTAQVLADSERASKKTRADIEIIRGIINGIKGDKPRARKHFDAALQIIPGYQLAKDNLLKLVDPTGTTAIDDRMVQQDLSERIEGKIIERMYMTSILTTEKPKTQIFIHKKERTQLEHSKLLAYWHTLDENEVNRFSFHVTLPDAPSNVTTQKGIRRNDPRSKITGESVYGKPSKEIQLGQGTWLIYDKYNLIFELDEQQKLRRWATFRVKLNVRS